MALVDAALERLELICDTYLSVSTPVQVAAAELLDRGAARPRADRGARRGELSLRCSARSAGIAVVPACCASDGGWYAVLQVPSLESEEDLVVALLTTDGVLVHPGYFFDFPARVVPRRQPAAARATRSPTASRASCGTSLARVRPRHELPRPAGAARACSSRCSRARPPTSWGIGDIGDSSRVTAWLAAAGQRVLQLLPLNEMAPGQQSPYSAISAMAIDPIFIRVPDVPEFAALGGEASLLAGRSRRARGGPRARRGSTHHGGPPR